MLRREHFIIGSLAIVGGMLISSKLLSRPAGDDSRAKVVKSNDEVPSSQGDVDVVLDDEYDEDNKILEDDFCNETTFLNLSFDTEQQCYEAEAHNLRRDLISLRSQYDDSQNELNMALDRVTDLQMMLGCECTSKEAANNELSMLHKEMSRLVVENEDLSLSEERLSKTQSTLQHALADIHFELDGTIQQNADLRYSYSFLR